MHDDKILTGIVILSFAVLLLILILKRLKQPYFVAYILTGILLGPDVPGIFNKEDFIFQFGELGLILLLFFIGAEIKLPDLTKNFKKPVLAAISQLLLSLRYFTAWSVP